MDYYNEISRGYNQLHFGGQQKKAETIKKNIQLTGLLLDIGAGTGQVTSLFEDSAECIALDPAFEMVKQFSGMKVVARAEQLPFRDTCFDSVISLTALHHSNLEIAKREIDRVVKKNGKIAISFFKRAKNFSQAKTLFREFRQIDSEKDLVFILP